METDEYLTLTEKGAKVLELTFKASIEEWSKAKLDDEIKKVMEDNNWNIIIGKDQESVIK